MQNLDFSPLGRAAGTFLVNETLTGERIGWKNAIHLTFMLSGWLFAA